MDLDVYEGPLDLLLDLARREKVDLSRVSISRLAQQYLDFIEHAQRLKLEVAGDLLVMAAWLAYLKSRLLLPQADPEAEEISAEEMAAELAHRLRRLDAMRAAGEELADRARLGREVFPRGMPEGVAAVTDTVWTADLYALVQAYARQRVTAELSHVTIRPQPVLALADARAALEELIGRRPGWQDFIRLLDQLEDMEAMPRSVCASSFSAALELVKEGAVDLEQDAVFAPIRLRRRDA